MSEKEREGIGARRKASYIGAPACFALEIACKVVQDAFWTEDGLAQVYIVGSALERPDWRDVDVRMILDDAAFQALFPGVSIETPTWEFDPRWTLLMTALSLWMRRQTGLPIDFQMQPMTFANEHHNKPRHAAGLRYLVGGGE